MLPAGDGNDAVADMPLLDVAPTPLPLTDAGSSVSGAEPSSFVDDAASVVAADDNFAGKNVI